MKTDPQITKKRMAEFAETCRRHGIKATHQRTQIYRELVRTTEHPDAETIYRRVRRRIPAISRDTVYRNLRLFEEKGVISRVESQQERVRFDARQESHHHFVCTVCGSIFDFVSKALDDLPIPKAVGDLGTMESAQVQVRGVCAACARRGGRS